MTANDPLDRDLVFYLESEAPTVAPAGLHDGVMDLARRARQRPGWLVGVRGGTYGTSGRGWDLTTGRAGYALVIVGLLMAALLVAIAGGAFRPSPPNPLLARNGPIVYVLQDQRPGFYFVNPDGSGRHDDVGGSCPTFSPDGSVLAYWSGTPLELVIARADGAAPRRLSVFDEGGHPEDRFALSPDGRQFAWIKRIRAFERADPDGSTTIDGWDDELWIMPVAGGPGVRILPISGETASRGLPVWSPDGRRIAYSTFVAGEANTYRSSIDVVGVDGTNRRRLTTRAAGGLAGMSWSPDGRFIAFAGVPNPPRLPSPGSRDWAPDGNDPPLDLFVIGADGTGERNLTNSVVGESAPQWSPDGSHLAYLTFVPTSGGQRLDTVRMDGPAALEPRFLGPAVSPYFTWSPDGTRLLVLTETASGQTVRGRTTRSTLKVVDAEFRAESTTLVAVDSLVLCAPSWQRLDP